MWVFIIHVTGGHHVSHSQYCKIIVKKEGLGAVNNTHKQEVQVADAVIC